MHGHSNRPGKSSKNTDNMRSGDTNGSSGGDRNSNLGQPGDGSYRQSHRRKSGFRDNTYPFSSSSPSDPNRKLVCESQDVRKSPQFKPKSGTARSFAQFLPSALIESKDVG